MKETNTTISDTNQLDNKLDYFVEEDGIIFAGRHLIIDIWGASNLDDLQIMRDFLNKSIKDCVATLLHMHLHHFSPNNGISGVAVLAESHISFHTWPEKNFAAFDVFMCGNDTNPYAMIDNIKASFCPDKVDVTDLKRGKIDNH